MMRNVAVLILVLLAVGCVAVGEAPVGVEEESPVRWWWPLASGAAAFFFWSALRVVVNDLHSSYHREPFVDMLLFFSQVPLLMAAGFFSIITCAAIGDLIEQAFPAVEALSR